MRRFRRRRVVEVNPFSVRPVSQWVHLINNIGIAITLLTIVFIVAVLLLLISKK